MGHFTPRKGHIFKIRYFITSANEIVRLLQKKWNDFLNFYGNGEQNGKPIFTFFTVVLKFHVRVSSSPCFSSSSLEIIYDYLSDRFQRTKINTSFSSWSALLCGVPQGSVNGPKYFNIYLNDLFYLFIYTSVCIMADDTTPYACDMDLGNLIRNLEGDSALAIEWFEANYMIANGSKCHLRSTKV